MNRIPIVFNFDENYAIQAGVCITSLMENIGNNCLCDIFIMYSSNRLSKKTINRIISLKEKYNNCEFTLLDLKDKFNMEFVSGRIPIDAYFRLLIPEYINGYKKVIYSDVDIVFTSNISSVLEIDISDYYCAGVLAKFNGKHELQYIDSLGIDTDNYINAGFLVFNIDKILYDDVINERLKPLLGKKYLFQDQDIINIAFKDYILNIDEKYNYFSLNSQYSNTCLSSIPVVLHYIENKPWNTLVPYNDLWWEYYRKSIFFKDSVYREYQNNIYNKFIKYNFLLTLLDKFRIIQIYKILSKILPRRIKFFIKKFI